MVLSDLSELSKDEGNIDVIIKSKIIFSNRPIEIIRLVIQSNY